MADSKATMSFARKCCFFLSYRCLRRVVTCLTLAGLAVAIVILLFPGEHGKNDYSVKGNKTAAIVLHLPPKSGFYERNSTLVLQG